MPRGSVESQAILSEADALGYRAEDLARWEPNEHVWSVQRALDRIAAGHAGIVFVGPTAPAEPAIGQEWLDTSTDGTGGIGVLAIDTITADVTLTTSQTVLLFDASLGPIVATLPPASANKGRRYFLVKIDPSSNSVTIKGDADETINGALTIVIAEQYGVRAVVSDRTQWWGLQEIQMVDVVARATLAQILEALERIQQQLALVTGAELKPGDKLE